MKLPIVLLHVCWQPPFSVSHSFTSIVGVQQFKQEKAIFCMLTNTVCCIYESESLGACTSEATWYVDTHLFTVVGAHSAFVNIYSTIIHTYMLAILAAYD